MINIDMFKTNKYRMIKTGGKTRDFRAQNDAVAIWGYKEYLKENTQVLALARDGEIILTR